MEQPILFCSLWFLFWLNYDVPRQLMFFSPVNFNRSEPFLSPSFMTHLFWHQANLLPDFLNMLNGSIFCFVSYWVCGTLLGFPCSYTCNIGLRSQLSFCVISWFFGSFFIRAAPRDNIFFIIKIFFIQLETFGHQFKSNMINGSIFFWLNQLVCLIFLFFFRPSCFSLSELLHIPESTTLCYAWLSCLLGLYARLI